MMEELKNARLVTALRLAFYPAFESAAAKRFQALTRQVQDAQNAGDLARAEQLYLSAIRAAEASSDRSHLGFMRHGLAYIYQEQKKYREAEVILRQQLEQVTKGAEVHGAHMALARLYQAEGKPAQAEEHYKAALAQKENSTDREMYFSTALSLARFYVEQHRYTEAEPIFKRALEFREAKGPADSSLAHYLQESAKVYEALEKYEPAEDLYRRALRISEQVERPTEFVLVHALDELARFCLARGQYVEAEELARRSLALVEEKMREVTHEHARVPVSAALDQLAEIYERQDKYAESEPLRRRSVEIKEQAWGERNGWIWVDSLAAHANALRKTGREDEAAKLDKRVELIRAKFPPGSVRTQVRLTSYPMKKTLRRRFSMFVNALRHPSIH